MNSGLHENVTYLFANHMFNILSALRSTFIFSLTYSVSVFFPFDLALVLIDYFQTV